MIVLNFKELKSARGKIKAQADTYDAHNEQLIAKLEAKNRGLIIIANTRGEEADRAEAETAELANESRRLAVKLFSADARIKVLKKEAMTAPSDITEREKALNSLFEAVWAGNLKRARRLLKGLDDLKCPECDGLEYIEINDRFDPSSDQHVTDRVPCPTCCGEDEDA